MYMYTHTHLHIISYPPCRKVIRPGIYEKPAVSHGAGGRVRHGWLNTDTKFKI